MTDYEERLRQTAGLPKSEWTATLLLEAAAALADLTAHLRSEHERGLTDGQAEAKAHDDEVEQLDELLTATRGQLEKAEAHLAALATYLQHKKDCETQMSTNELKGICTCGLDQLVRPNGATEPE